MGKNRFGSGVFGYQLGQLFPEECQSIDGAQLEAERLYKVFGSSVYVFRPLKEK